MEWFWPVLIGWILLLLVFLWKEWTTSGQKRLGLKTGLIFISLSSLAMLALKPAVSEEIKEERLAITTANFNQKQLDSLQKVYPKLKVKSYNTETSLSGLENPKEIFVLGEGLQTYDLWALKDKSVTYLPEEIKSGIIQLKYDKHSRVGDSLSIVGRFKTPKFHHKLILEDASGIALDSVVFSSESDELFKLSSPLNVAGKFVFSLAEKDSLGKVVNREPLPLKVEEKQALRILMLNTYPTFEIKYLKNLLAELGHEVVLRTQMTTGKYKFEFFNSERVNLNRLTTTNLEDFDLLISDVESIQTSGNSEKIALKTSVNKLGLGLLILDEANNFSTLKGFSVPKVQRGTATEVVLDQLSGNKVSRQPFQLQSDLGLEGIHSSNTAVLSGYKRQGKGRIGTTVLQNIWQLQLQGKQDVYQQLWTELVERLSKKNSKSVTWHSKQTFSYVDEPLDFEFRTSFEEPKLKDTKNRSVSVKQDLQLPEVWSATTYPLETGWQSVRLEQDTIASFDYYVHSEEDWQAIKSYQTTGANHRLFQEEMREDKELMEAAIPINPLWFFSLFLMGLGGLWLEPKL